MSYKLACLAALFLSPFTYGQTLPLTQKEICKRFMPSVVRIDTAADTVASGFIVSSDGWIVTVAHIFFDERTHQQISTVSVHLPDGSFAVPRVERIDAISISRDFALLKVDKSNLPFLEIGDESEISPGSDVGIIGYPFSAGTEKILPTKFCLAGIIAATDTITKNGVNVHAIYFQGPAVKGLSGSPIIARDTGHVIGIQSEKLAGITNSLGQVRRTLQTGPAGGQVSNIMSGVDFGATMIDLINVLDRHLANGLGTAVGIDDANYALRKAKKQKSP